MLKGKIHRATVTEADLNYMGSLTLDEDLMDAMGVKEFEKIQVLDVTNGSRLEKYIPSKRKIVKLLCTFIFFNE